MARMVSVNVGTLQQIAVRRGRPQYSAIGKAPVEGPVRVEGVNVAGDDQADRRVHGGPDKAVDGYASDDAAWWSRELGRDLPPGMFGENLTTEGVDVSGEDVQELLDLPGAPLPDPETPAPVRLVPTWDAMLLARARRTGALPEEHRPRIFNTKMPQSVPTFLVDGAVAGAWRHSPGGIEIEPFERLDRAALRAVREETERVLTLFA